VSTDLIVAAAAASFCGASSSGWSITDRNNVGIAPPIKSFSRIAPARSYCAVSSPLLPRLWFGGQSRAFGFRCSFVPSVDKPHTNRLGSRQAREPLNERC